MSKLFAPLGWVLPTLIPFQIFLQDLWKDGSDWDTPLNSNHRETLQTIQTQLDGILKSRDGLGATLAHNGLYIALPLGQKRTTQREYYA